MTAPPEDLPHWERPRFQPGGASAFLLYVLYGVPATEAAAVSPAYRTTGLPDTVQLRRVLRTEGTPLPFTGGDYAAVLRDEDPGQLARLEAATECLVLQGEVPDPADLNYLRNTVGVIASLLDQTGGLVLDVLRLKLYGPARWRQEIFEPNPPKLSAHAVILASSESDGTRWFHTRGLRKFGRPDLSMRGVAPEQQGAVVDLFNRLINFQAQGALIEEGQEIRINALPAGLTCHHAGSFNDPAFNNVHIEIRWPAKYSF